MQLSQMELEGMGKEASSRYLLDKIPLNDTIIKMANTHNLNPHQVARICEAANTDVYSTLWGMTKNGQFTFDMADQEKIADTLNGVSEAKQASFLDESMVAPDKLASFLPEEGNFEDVEKTASFTLPEEEENISFKRFIKLAAEFKNLEEQAVDRLYSLYNKRNAAISKVTAMIKSAALQGEDISAAYFAAKYAFPNDTDIIKRTFSKVASDLKKYGISFKKSFMSKQAGKVINESSLGNRHIYGINNKHGLIKHLNTIVDCSRCIDDVTKAKGYICNKIEQIDNMVKRINYKDFEGTSYTDKLGSEKIALNNSTIGLIGLGTSMLMPSQVSLNAGINAYLNRDKFKKSMKGVSMIGGNNFLNGNGTPKVPSDNMPFSK